MRRSIRLSTPAAHGRDRSTLFVLALTILATPSPAAAQGPPGPDTVARAVVDAASRPAAWYPRRALMAGDTVRISPRGGVADADLVVAGEATWLGYRDGRYAYERDGVVRTVAPSAVIVERRSRQHQGREGRVVGAVAGAAAGALYSVATYRSKTYRTLDLVACPGSMLLCPVQGRPRTVDHSGGHLLAWTLGSAVVGSYVGRWIGRRMPRWVEVRIGPPA